MSRSMQMCFIFQKVLIVRKRERETERNRERETHRERETERERFIMYKMNRRKSNNRSSKETVTKLIISLNSQQIFF